MSKLDTKTKILNTQKALGITREKSILVAIQISKIEKEFKEPFNEILLAARAIYINWNGMDYLEVIRVIQDGFEANANAKGEFLDNIREFAAFLKNAHYDVSESIKIINLIKTDVEFSDKLIDIRYYS